MKIYSGIGKNVRILALLFMGLVFIFMQSTHPSYAAYDAISKRTPFYDPSADTCDAPPPSAAPSGSSPEAMLQALRALPLNEKIGELLMVGINSKDEGKSLVSKYQVGGIFLRSKHPELYNKAVIDEIVKSGKVPAFVSADEEGGKVSTLGGAVGSPPSAKVLGSKTPDEIKKIATDVGQKMADMGVTVDLAPVVDDDNGSNGAIAKFDRSFSSDINKVTTAAGAFADGLRASKVVPVFKHFPGIGNATGPTGGNSDTGRSVTPPLSSLEGNDLKPYEVLGKTTPAGVMLGNLVVPGLTEGKKPEQASLNKDAVSLLRDKYGFSQVIFTDEIADAVSVSKDYAPPQAVSLAIQAGVDMPLFNLSPKYKSIDEQVKAVVDQVQKDVAGKLITEDQINASLGRIAALKSFNQSPAAGPPTTPATTPATPPAGAPAAAGANASKIYVLGDSLTAGMVQQNLPQRLKDAGYNPVKVNGQGSRPLFYSTGGRSGSIIDGFTAINQDKADVQDASTVVIALGTNKLESETVYHDKVIEMIDLIHGTPGKPGMAPNARIFWQNLASKGRTAGVYSAHNVTLNTLSKEKGFTVINWEAIADPFISSGNVHPNNAGYLKMIELILSTIGPPSSANGAAASAAAPAANTQPCVCPDAGVSSGPSIPASASLEARQKYVYDFFIGKNYRAWQAAGIIGNMMHESGVEPQRLQGTPPGKITPAESAKGSSAGWGLVQFTPASKFINAINPISKANDMLTQLEFIADQLDGKTAIAEKRAGDEIRSTTNTDEATAAFQGTKKAGGKYFGYERPFDQSGSLKARQADARAVLIKFGSGAGSQPTGTPAGGTALSVTCSDSAGAAGSALLSTGTLTMADSVQPVPPPAGAVVMAGYITGHGQSRAWTTADWTKVKSTYKFLLPIYVAYSSFATPEADADSAVSQVKAIGLIKGAAIALDIEANVANKAGPYTAKWSDRVKADGFVPIIYTSLSTKSVVPSGVLDWIAYTRTGAQLDGHAAHQYGFKGAYDLSVIDSSKVPLWPTGKP